jgi:hypothetical protein
MSAKDHLRGEQEEHGRCRPPLEDRLECKHADNDAKSREDVYAPRLATLSRREPAGDLAI